MKSKSILKARRSPDTNDGDSVKHPLSAAEKPSYERMSKEDDLD